MLAVMQARISFGMDAEKEIWRCVDNIIKVYTIYKRCQEKNSLLENQNLAFLTESEVFYFLLLNFTLLILLTFFYLKLVKILKLYIDILNVFSYTFYMEKTQKKKLKWLFGQPEQILIEAIHKQRKLYHALKAQNKERNSDQLALEALIKVAEQIFDEEHHLTDRKTHEKDLNKLKAKVLKRIERHKTRYEEKKLQKRKRKNLKKEKIKMLMNEIKIMREQGQSFKAIAEYIERYHKLKLHPTYISKMLSQEQK